MPTIKFDEYLTEHLKNKEVKEMLAFENAKLESAVALMKARENAGLTQRELAELANVPQSTISRIEKGCNTRFDTLARIAFALGKQLKVEFV